MRWSLYSCARLLRWRPALATHQNPTRFAQLAGGDKRQRKIEPAGHINQLLKLNPNYSTATEESHNHLMEDQDFLKRFLDALRQAGLPEIQTGA